MDRDGKMGVGGCHVFGNGSWEATSHLRSTGLMGRIDFRRWLRCYLVFLSGSDRIDVVGCDLWMVRPI